MSDEYAEIRARFERETADHQMTVLHDDGLYRHLRFANKGLGSVHWFDLITWPGCLTIRGDINDAYVFTRLPDMFEFFRGTQINPHYWSQKLNCDRDRVMTYSEDRFRQHVAEYVADNLAEYPGLDKAVEKEIFGEFSPWPIHFEDGAREALDDFEYRPEGSKGERFRFYDTWEWDLRDWDWSFLWACHAIVWGIARYDARDRSEQGGGVS